MPAKNKKKRKLPELLRRLVGITMLKGPGKVAESIDRVVRSVESGGGMQPECVYRAMNNFIR